MVLAAAGCGSQEPTFQELNDTNIKKLRGAYGLFQVQHRMAGPKSEEEFKEYLSNDGGARAKMERMGVDPDNIDSIFVSERDGQPFKVKYGLNGLGDHAIVFEAEGVDGKRMVSLAEPREVDATEYEALWEQSKPVGPVSPDLVGG